MGSAGADVVKTSGGSVDAAAPSEAVIRGVSRVLTAADAAALSCCNGSKRVSVSKVLTVAGAAVQLEVPPRAMRLSSSAKCVSLLVSTATRSFMIMMRTSG